MVARFRRSSNKFLNMNITISNFSHITLHASRNAYSKRRPEKRGAFRRFWRNRNGVGRST
jgi:hypothetical protein